MLRRSLLSSLLMIVLDAPNGFLISVIREN